MLLGVVSFSFFLLDNVSLGLRLKEQGIVDRAWVTVTCVTSAVVVAMLAVMAVMEASLEMVGVSLVIAVYMLAAVLAVAGALRRQSLECRPACCKPEWLLVAAVLCAVIPCTAVLVMSSVKHSHAQKTLQMPVPEDEPVCESADSVRNLFYQGDVELEPMFAYLQPRERDENEAYWPCFPPDVITESFLEFCSADTCHCERLVLILECLEEEPLLRWVNDYVFSYMRDRGYDRTVKLRHPVGARQMAVWYVEQGREQVLSRPCRHDPDEHDAITEQDALFVGNSMVSHDVVTFMTHQWYDMMSCGDCTARSWHTVLRESGKEILLGDVIRKECMDELSDLIPQYLRNASGLWKDVAVEADNVKGADLVKAMSGFALVEEGMVVYYHPYVIGCGADGQFNALIPYEVLLPLVKDGCPGRDLMSSKAVD